MQYALCMKSNCFETHKSTVYFATNRNTGTQKIIESAGKVANRKKNNNNRTKMTGVAKKIINAAT